MNQHDRFAKFWNIKLATEQEAIARIKICKSCENYIKATNMCKKCGCFMPFKTKIKNMSCPIGLWSPEAEPVNKDSSGDNNGYQHRSPTE